MSPAPSHTARTVSTASPIAATDDFIKRLEGYIKTQLKSQRVGYLLGAGSSYLNGGGYPPDKQQKATETVLKQAKLLCSDWAA
jgi:hypothetical protein